MEDELLKCLVNFYAKLEAMDKKWKELSSNAKRTIEVLENQTEQLRHVTSSEVDNAELCRVEGLRERLIFKIHAGIEDEVALIQDTLSRLNNGSQDLKNRLMKLEEIRNKVCLTDESMKELVNGTSYRPKLNLLLEWAIDACDYYHNLYLGINVSLKALDYRDASTIERLAKSFSETESARTKIDRILAYTQFLAQEVSR